MLTLGRFGIEAKAEKLPVEIVDDCACQGRGSRGIGRAGPYHEVPVEIDPGINQKGSFNDRDAARTCPQVDNRIGRRLARLSRDDCDKQLDGAAGRLAAIFWHDEIAATSVGQLREAVWALYWVESRRVPRETRWGEAYRA